MSNRVCAIVGAGPGNGLSLGRKFLAEGYTTALLARSESNLDALRKALPGVHTYRCDVASGSSVESAFDRIAEELGRPGVLVYNAGSGVFGSIDDVDASAVEQAWRTNTLGCFNSVRSVLPGMRAAGGGSIVVMGATAAKRGGANFAAFASAKGAQYNLAQSMARHLGPENIHVAYIVIDGVIDIPRTRERLSGKPDDFFLDPDHIAEAVYRITEQPPSAWTFEIDLRPYCEKW